MVTLKRAVDGKLCVKGKIGRSKDGREDSQSMTSWRGGDWRRAVEAARLLLLLKRGKVEGRIAGRNGGIESRFGPGPVKDDPPKGKLD